MSKSKNGEVTSNFDEANVSLVSTGKALIGQGTELETAWFNDSTLLLIANKISVRGVQASMEKALEGFDDDVRFPSLTKSMVQNFVQAYELMQKRGWKGLPVEAIRIVQSGKRSEAFESSKEYDDFQATTASAKEIIEQASKPKRATSTKPKVEGATVTNLDGEKVQTFGEAVSELLKIAGARTSHFLDENALKDARVLMAILNKQIKAQESKDAQAVQAVA